MNNVERERLAFSAVLSLILYVVLFLVTGWLDILRPSEPRRYHGPIIVNLALDPSMAPVIVAAEEPTEERVQEPVRPAQDAPAEPEPVREPEPPPVEPETKPEPEPPSVEPEPVRPPEPPTTVPQERPEPVRPPERVATAPEPRPVPVPEPRPEPRQPAPEPEPAVEQPEPEPAPPRQPAAPENARTATAQEAPSHELSSSETPRRDAPRVAEETGPDSELSPLQSDEGREVFRRPPPPRPEDRPTTQFGESGIDFGDDDPQEAVRADTGAVESEASDQDERVFDDSRIARLDETLQSTPPAIEPRRDPTDGAAGEQVPPSGAPGDQTIVAEDLFELDQQRNIRIRVDPVIPPGALVEGQPRVGVDLRFDIEPSGLVRNVQVHRSSGYPRVDSAIVEAVRQWLFAPVSVDRIVPVRLRYVIVAD